MFRRWAVVSLATVLTIGCAAAVAWCGTPPNVEPSSAVALRGDLAAAGFSGTRDGVIEWRDYDGDGDQDFVLLVHDGSRELTRVYRNDGHGVFTANTECVTVDGVTTCKGDQSEGIHMQESTKPILLWVQELTKNITPDSSVAGVEARAYGADGVDGHWGSVNGDDGAGGFSIEVHFVGSDRAIVIRGNDSEAITARSQGGHGGDGMTVLAGGGDGGAGGAGGPVTIESNAKITASGEGVRGIDAESVGGDGGTGASATVAGRGGAGGAGGDITVTSHGAITTAGDYSSAISARSDGGYGKGGGDGLAPASGGAGGAGGTVTIVNSGVVTTTGVSTEGISARSDGGWGGEGGSGTFGAAGGAGGSGGTLSITNSGAITAHGESAFGIFAYSAGGEGGSGGGGILDGAHGTTGNGGAVSIVNTADLRTDGAGSGGIYARSYGNNGGAVTVEQTGDITAHGDYGFGIIGYSTALDGHAGDVEIKTDGDVTADGVGAFGIGGFSDTWGDGTAGKVTIRVNGGTVLGGASGGAGVYIEGGSSNLLENHGSIGSVSGLEGVAIQTGSGNDVVDNFGTVTGRVGLGGGTNVFNNNSGGVFNAGPVVALGDGGKLFNSGVFSPGGASFGATTVSGEFIQNADGTLDIQVGKNASDQLIVSETATLGGTLKVEADHDVYHDGDTYDVLAADGIEGSFGKVVLPQTAFLKFETQDVKGGIQVKVAVTPFQHASTSQLQQAIAACLDNCAGHATGDYSHMIGQFQLASAAQVTSAFYSLSPGSFDNLTRGAILSAQLHQDDLVQRMNTARSRPSADMVASAGRAYEQGRGWWLSGSYLGADQDPSGGFLKHSYTTTGGRLGYENAMGRTIVGGSAGYLHSKATLDGNGTEGKINGYIGSVYGGHLWGATYAQSVLSFLVNRFDNSRDVIVGAEQRVATSKFNGNAFTAFLTGGQRMMTGRWGIEPYAALRYARLSENGFTETGAGSVNLKVDQRSNNWMASDVGVRFNTTIMKDEAAFLPELHVAWNHDYGLSDRNITATFEGDPDMPFTVAGQNVKADGVIAGLGLTYHTTAGWKASARYDRNQRGDFAANSFSLRIGSGF